MGLKSETYRGHKITFEQTSKGIRAYNNELGENYYKTKKEALNDYKRTLDIFEYNIQKDRLNSFKYDTYMIYTKKNKEDKIIIFNVENFLLPIKSEQEKYFVKSLVGKSFKSEQELKKFVKIKIEDYVYGK